MREKMYHIKLEQGFVTAWVKDYATWESSLLPQNAEKFISNEFFECARAYFSTFDVSRVWIMHIDDVVEELLCL